MNQFYTFLKSANQAPLRRICIILLCVFSFIAASAQTTIPLPPYGSSYAGNTRGMWFVAPTNFTITGLRVPIDVGTGNQSVHLVKFVSVPPAYASTTTAFTTLYYGANIAGTNFIPVSIQITSGDIIGVIGARNNGSGTGLTSYASTTVPFASTIAGLPITLSRLGWQGSILTSPATDFWTEASTVGRIEINYVTNTGKNNAGISALVSPVNFCGGIQPLKVRVANKGTNRLDSVRVNWRMDGIDQTTTYFKSPLDTMGGTNYPNDTVLTLGSINFSTIAAKILKVWTSYPNGVVDTVPLDDTLNTTLRPALSGSFTIGGAGANYATFALAAADLNNFGVCGPVTFTVNPGTYVEKLTLNAISGTSAVNTVTFDGVDSSTRIIQFTETTTAANIGVVSLIGASYVTIKNLKIVNLGVSYGAGVSIQSGSNNNTISNCRINVANASSSYIFGVGICGLTYSTTSTGKNNTIKNCKIVGGYMGVSLYGGSTTSFVDGNSVIACDISGGYLYGIFDYYQNLNTITDNRVLLTTATNTYGIYTYYCQNNKIDRNIVVSGYMGLYIYNNNNAGTTRMSCSNNIINMNGPYQYSTNYGLYALYNVNGDFLHNTVYTAPTVSSGYASYLGYGSGCNFQNNIFQSNNSAMYAIYCPSVTFTTFDNNIIYAPGATYVYWGTAAYANLQALQAGATAFHQKSLFKVANFLSLVNHAEDLHLNNSVAATYGNPLYTTPTDVDGDLRCQFSPTIGADESKFGSGAPVANFTTPDTIFVNSPVTLLNNNLVGSPLGHKWYVDGAFKGSTWDLPYKFTATGTFVVKLVTQGCFGTDSITRTITVYNPTMKPIANFISDLNTVETYQNLTLKDLSIKGPTYWYWTFTPSIGVNYNNGTSNTSQNPQVNFANPGLYQVCMWLEQRPTWLHVLRCLWKPAWSGFRIHSTVGETR